MARLPRKFKKAWKKGKNITQKMCNKYMKYMKQIGISFHYDTPSKRRIRYKFELPKQWGTKEFNIV